MMRGWLRTALAVMVLCVSVPALAQQSADGKNDKDYTFVRVGGMYSADSTKMMLRLDASGNVYVSDYAPNRDNVRTLHNVIASDSLRYASTSIGADSSAVLDVHDLRHLKMLIKATPLYPNASPTVRLAIQLRECLDGSADSASVFPSYQVPFVSAASAGASPLDSLNFGHVLSGSASAPWSGEFVVTIALNRSAGAGAGTTYYYPSGVAIMLDRLFGTDAWWNKLQVRVRPLCLPAVKVNIALVGTSL